MKLKETRRILFLPLLLLLGGCGGGDSEADEAPVATADTASVAPDTTAAEPAIAYSPRDSAPDLIRGLYLNAYAAGSRARLPRLLAMAENTEINAFVVDVKDERGIRYQTELELPRELALDGEVTIANLSALADTLEAHDIYAIARIVVFNDPVLSEARPQWSIRKEDGSVWLDRSGHSWVSPWDREVWEYNLAIAEEVARAGFDEIQFEYVRFPEQFQSLPPQVHPEANGEKVDAIVGFLEEANRRLHPLGVTVTADVFGLSPNTYTDVELGQQWERISAVTDHILPMMYPSHYYSTHLPNVPRPHAMPYETIYKAAGMAKIRRDRMVEAGLDPARIIVWLEAFQATWLRDGITYGPEELRAQKRGVYDVGLNDWILWHPGSQYEPFLAALEPTAESRAVETYTPPDDVLAQVNSFERLGVAAAREAAAAAAD